MEPAGAQVDLCCVQLSGPKLPDCEGGGGDRPVLPDHEELSAGGLVEHPQQSGGDDAVDSGGLMNAPPEARRSGTGKGTGRSPGHRRANRRRPRRWPTPGSQRPVQMAHRRMPAPACGRAHRVACQDRDRPRAAGVSTTGRTESRGRHRRTSSHRPTAPPDGLQKSGPSRETPRRAQRSPATTPGYSRARMVRPRIAPLFRSAGDPGAVDGPAGTTIIGRPTERATVPGPA